MRTQNTLHMGFCVRKYGQRINTSKRYFSNFSFKIAFKMGTALNICFNNSSNVFAFQECEVGVCAEEITSMPDLALSFLETYASLEIKKFRSRCLVRMSKAKFSNTGRIIKCDPRVQQLLELCSSDDAEERDFIVSRFLMESAGTCERVDLLSKTLPIVGDEQFLNVTWGDFKVLTKKTIKSMKITVICSGRTNIQQFFTSCNEDAKVCDVNSNLCYRRNLSNWKIVRAKINDIFQSYDLYVQPNTIVDLRQCPLSKLSSYLFPSVAFVVVNECIMNYGGSVVSDIGHINSRTKINIQDIHDINYFHRMYIKNISSSCFASALHTETQRLLETVFRTKIRVCLLNDQMGSRRCVSSSNFLISGPKSSGKKLLVKEVARKTAANLIIFDISSESILNITRCSAFCKSIFNEAVESCFSYPTILLLLRLDILFTDKKSEVLTKSSQSALNKKKLVNLICDLFDAVPQNNLLSIIAVTEYPYLIHHKLRRVGRLDREIYLKAPSSEDRYDILKVLVEEWPSLKNIDLRSLAEITPGYAGTDLRRLVHLAVLKSNEENCVTVSQNHLKHALSRVLPSVLQGSLGVVDFQSVSSLDHIIGLDSVKSNIIKTIIWPIKYSAEFRKMGISPSKGLLIFGPPGCAKTTLVRAVASLNKINFLSVSAAELYTSGVGDSEKLITDLYNRARMASPCIVFIDELELIVSSRSAEKTSNFLQASLLSVLLTEIDGVSNSGPPVLPQDSNKVVENSVVVTVAATNRPDLIDSALLRPGRFDRIIPVPPPDELGRFNLLKEITKSIPMSDVNLDQLARETQHFSGADLVNLCQEAALNALGENMNVKTVTMENFNNAKIDLGPSLTSEILQSFHEYVDLYSPTLKSN